MKDISIHKKTVSSAKNAMNEIGHLQKTIQSISKSFNVDLLTVVVKEKSFVVLNNELSGNFEFSYKSKQTDLYEQSFEYGINNPIINTLKLLEKTDLLLKKLAKQYYASLPNIISKTQKEKCNSLADTILILGDFRKDFRRLLKDEKYLDTLERIIE
jgi:hypothetical protein